MLTFAQNSQNAASPAIDKNKIISNLLQRIDADEQLIKTLEQREHDLADEIEKANQAHAALTEAHKQALLELGELRATIKYLKEVNEDRKAQVELWRSEAARLEKELKASRKREMLLLVGHIIRSVIGR